MTTTADTTTTRRPFDNMSTDYAGSRHSAGCPCPMCDYQRRLEAERARR